MIRTTVENLANDMVDLLKPLEEKYGVKISRGNATFGDYGCAIKIEAKEIGKDGEAKSPEADGKSYKFPVSVVSNINNAKQ